MKVLIVGGGGREHALAWKIAQSPRVSRVYCAPGNGGTGGIGGRQKTIRLKTEGQKEDPTTYSLQPSAFSLDIKGRNIPLEVTAIRGLRDFAAREGIGLTVVGPELPLTLGLVDEFEKSGLRAFGPGGEAAELEGSKSFAKEVMSRAGIPTAAYAVVESPEEADKVLEKMGAPIVVKADGLAGGKGVLVCHRLDEARAAVRSMMMGGSLGQAGRRLVLEEFLEGEEASYLCLTDGRTVLPLEASQDHKALGDNDLGPNTGGMGAYSPVPVLEGERFHRVTREIALPTVRAMADLGRPYRGVLYIGLMMTPQGPKVLEFNARFGDPETQPLMMRMDSDLVPFLEAVVEGRLAEEREILWKKDAAVCVVMVSRGYPGPYEKGQPIEGLEEVASWPNLMVFHAGTRREAGRLLTQGGRVLGVTCRASTLKEAIERVYQGVRCIRWEGVYYRTDIGHRALRISQLKAQR